jgi:hypothetical protein
MFDHAYALDTTKVTDNLTRFNAAFCIETGRPVDESRIDLVDLVRKCRDEKEGPKR